MEKVCLCCKYWCSSSGDLHPSCDITPIQPENGDDTRMRGWTDNHAFWCGPLFGCILWEPIITDESE